MMSSRQQMQPDSGMPWRTSSGGVADPDVRAVRTGRRFEIKLLRSSDGCVSFTMPRTNFGAELGHRYAAEVRSPRRARLSGRNRPCSAAPFRHRAKQAHSESSGSSSGISCALMPVRFSRCLMHGRVIVTELVELDQEVCVDGVVLEMGGNDIGNPGHPLDAVPDMTSIDLDRPSARRPRPPGC